MLRALVYVSLFIAVSLAACGRTDSIPQPEVISRGLREVSKLQLLEVECSRVGLIGDEKLQAPRSLSDKIVDAAANQFKIGPRIEAHKLTLTVSAYIDLSRMTEADVSVADGAVKVSLPDVEVEIVGRDVDFPLVYTRVSVFRSQVTERERAALKDYLARSIEALYSPGTPKRAEIEERARETARQYVETWAAARGLKAVCAFRNQGTVGAANKAAGNESVGNE